jgi:hypothetical protein
LVPAFNTSVAVTGQLAAAIWYFVGKHRPLLFGGKARATLHS